MKTFRSAPFPLMATATPGLAALLLSASLLVPMAACARESAQAAPRAVAPRGALLSEEQAGPFAALAKLRTKPDA